MALLLAGNGRFDFEVVGESYRQASLRALAGSRQLGGCEVECLAALVFHDANAYDPQAVAVFIVRADTTIGHVGFLARAKARRYRKAVAEVGGENPNGMLCRALIVGGWFDPDGADGLYGVKLDLVLPITFRTAAAWENWSKRLL